MTAGAPWPFYSQAEIDAVESVLRSGKVNYWTGQCSRTFETAFAEWTRSSHAIALANGTVALDLALQALNIGLGDEVIVTPRTFIASVSSVVLRGATPVFADVDSESGNISADTIEPVLTKRTKAIVPVHLGGWPCDMPAIMALARAHSLSVIEDCAQAHGARIDGQMVGTFGQVGAWSFCQDKIMTTGGEGGMVTTDDAELWSLMWSFKDHGKSWDAIYNRIHSPGYRWVHESFGTNWRMIEMQAAIGLAQLDRMPEWTERRAANAKAFHSVLARYPGAVRAPLPSEHLTHAFYRLYAYAKPSGLKSGWSRDRIVSELAARGVPAMQGSCGEVYREKAFDGTPWRPPVLPVARELGETSIAFLVHPTINAEHREQWCIALNEVLAAAAA
jgi:dTDP-4-amino-4,6-dideoxygalactose transaminase